MRKSVCFPQVNTFFNFLQKLKIKKINIFFLVTEHIIFIFFSLKKQKEEETKRKVMVIFIY